jgi:hypothetical protein
MVVRISEVGDGAKRVEIFICERRREKKKDTI